LGLKHLVLIDVMAIGGLFVLRAAAGAEAVHVRISPWLLVCTALLALFLGLAKRRAELVLVGAERTPGRPVLEGYSLELVDQLVSVVAASTISAYALYTFTARDSKATRGSVCRSSTTRTRTGRRGCAAESRRRSTARRPWRSSTGCRTSTRGGRSRCGAAASTSSRSSGQASPISRSGTNPPRTP